MNAFIHILQKSIKTQKVLYPHQELRRVDHKDTNELLFKPMNNSIRWVDLYSYQSMTDEQMNKHTLCADSNVQQFNIWNSYYKNEINKDNDHTVYWAYHYMNSLFYNIDAREILECELQDQTSSISSIKNKYKKIKNILDNIFIDNKTKKAFLNNISKTQRAYRGFSKLAQVYKYKKSEIQITTNMMFDEIEPNHRNTIKIYHEGSRYLFTKYDLLRIINNSLMNSPYYFAEPLIIRNPYNNVPFSKSILYTIYFRLIDNPLKFPVLFHNFVWLDFDLHLFRAENECLIREQYFREYIYNTTQETMNYEIRSMLYTYYPGKINIVEDFPIIDLIRIFRPYYYLYLVSHYHIGGLEKRKMASEYLTHRLYELYIYNPLFGREVYMKKTDTEQKKRFNTDAPVFTMNQAYAYHLHKNCCYDDDDDDDDEYDDNSVS